MLTGAGLAAGAISGAGALGLGARRKRLSGDVDGVCGHDNVHFFASFHAGGARPRQEVIQAKTYDLERGQADCPIGYPHKNRPRHADLLLVTGPVSRNMETALKRTYDAVPEPKLVVAVGDCACDGGIFGESYATCGKVANVIPVDVTLPGCPPPPLDILRGILTAVRRRC